MWMTYTNHQWRGIPHFSLISIIFKTCLYPFIIFIWKVEKQRQTKISPLLLPPKVHGAGSWSWEQGQDSNPGTMIQDTSVLRVSGKWVRPLPTNLLFPPPVSGGSGETTGEAAPSLPTISVPENGEWPPDIYPGSLMWSMLQGFCLNGFDTSEMLSLSLIQGWGNPSRVHGLTQST